MNMYVRFIPLHLLDISGGNMEYVELLNVTKAVSNLSFTQVPRLIKALRHSGWIAGDCKPGASICITDAGTNELLMHQEIMDESAKKERQNRINTYLNALNCVIALASLVFGIIIEHNWRILDFFISLFH